MGCGKLFTEKEHKTHYCYNCANMSDILTEQCKKCYTYYECGFEPKL